MKNLILIASIVLLFSIGYSQDMDVSCIGCHSELDEPASTPVELFENDVHSLAGLNCADCHGGDIEAWDFDEAKSEDAGFIGIPEGSDIIAVCSKCHSDPAYMRNYNPNLPTDQEAKYWTSGHGMSLAKGNTDVATCTSCHDVHGIKKKNNPASSIYHANVAETCGRCHSNAELMTKYNLPSTTLDQYKNSVHGVALLENGDIAAPTCNNCHGNHGAAPPDIGSIQEVCGTCHVQNQDLFSKTKMHKAFLSTDIHGCAACHTAHDIKEPNTEMISIDEGGICKKCHFPGDEGSTIGAQIRGVVDDLSRDLEAAEVRVSEIEQKGLEVDELLFDLQNGHSALIHTRTYIHSFDLEQVKETAKEGFTVSNAVVEQANLLEKDFNWRRIGLGIASILISFLSIILYLYIRSIEKE